ncbi:MAG: FAD:protein FMN transferase [Longimicrobiales bacterium]|nr:FAD:protein FMN transferase [Longimicrobiales bacterium]
MCQDARSTVWVEREAHLMGTRLRMRVEAPDRTSGLRATERAFSSVREAESLLSTWRPDTEVSRLNRAPVHQPTPVSTRLASLLEEVLAWSEETGGAFDPVSGALVDTWDLRGDGAVPSAALVEAAVAATGSGGFRLVDGGRGAIRLHPAAWIDAGGFGKGLALRVARKALLESGIRRGILDFGGQIETLGEPDPEEIQASGGNPGLVAEIDGESGWRISVADPGDRRVPAAELCVGEASAATSGGSERFVLREGRRWSHVVDPRSGRAVPPWGSVTVVADDPLIADVLSTALFVMGPEEGMRWSKGRSDVAALFLERSSGRVHARWTPAMERFLYGCHRASDRSNIRTEIQSSIERNHP